MSETKIGKIILGVIVALIVIVASTQVFADDTFTDLSDTLNTTNTATNNNALENTTNSTTNNTTSNLTGVNNSVLTTNNTISNATNNAIKANNSALPNTGIEDTMPVTIMVVVLGISAVYAYKKIQDYKNI